MLHGTVRRCIALSRSIVAPPCTIRHCFTLRCASLLHLVPVVAALPRAIFCCIVLRCSLLCRLSSLCRLAPVVAASPCAVLCCVACAVLRCATLYRWALCRLVTGAVSCCRCTGFVAGVLGSPVLGSSPPVYLDGLLHYWSCSLLAPLVAARRWCLFSLFIAVAAHCWCRLSLLLALSVASAARRWCLLSLGLLVAVRRWCSCWRCSSLFVAGCCFVAGTGRCWCLLSLALLVAICCRRCLPLVPFVSGAVYHWCSSPLYPTSA
jgi:hypothetical protein